MISLIFIWSYCLAHIFFFNSILSLWVTVFLSKCIFLKQMHLSCAALSCKLEDYLTQMLLRITGKPISSTWEGSYSKHISQNNPSRKSKNLKFDVLTNIQEKHRRFLYSERRDNEREQRMKAGYAIKKMGKDENYCSKESWARRTKVHRRGKAKSISYKKNITLVSQYLHWLFIHFQAINYVTILICKDLRNGSWK